MSTLKCCKCDGKGGEDWVSIHIYPRYPRKCSKCDGPICYHCMFYPNHIRESTRLYDEICFNSQPYDTASTTRSSIVAIIHPEKHSVNKFTPNDPLQKQI